MEEKRFSVAILGGGSRGLDTYANFMSKAGHFDIVAVCDVRPVRLEFAQEKYNVKMEWADTNNIDSINDLYEYKQYHHWNSLNVRKH